MRVEVAKTAGFCFGVKRAVDTVYECAEQSEGKRIFTYGPIIHNEEVVEDLRSKGVETLNNDEELKAAAETDHGAKVIIRSHGVGRSTFELIEDLGFEIVDATCPFVSKIHRIAEEASAAGEHVIVVGSPDHAEVLGIVGWVSGDYSVIQSVEDVQALNIDRDTHVCIVSQTTFNYQKFNIIVEELKKMFYYSRAVNTICNATHARQSEAKELASRVDTMIVLGGKNSSNTQKLYDICHKECQKTYYIQTVRDLNTDYLPFGGVVGITAGASTPIYIIEEVRNLCQKLM